MKKRDKELRERVEQALESNPEVISTEINVATEAGVVILTGFVQSYSEKLAAGKAVKRTRGVKRLADDLAVRAVFKIADPHLAAQAVRALEMRNNVPGGRIKVSVKDNFIYLAGTVDYAFEKEAAEDAVSYLRGTLGVVNKIEVRPTVSDDRLKYLIEQAFRWKLRLNPDRVIVTARNGSVKLWGSVPNWDEGHEIEQAVRQMPGVAAVENHLKIEP